MELPESVQEIADVIGREQALYLIGQLPQSGRRSWRVSLWVPKRLRPDHPLVSLVGWEDAQALSRALGGSILQPSNCRHVYRRYRNKTICRLARDGLEHREIGELVGLSVRQIRNVIAEARERVA